MCGAAATTARYPVGHAAHTLAVVSEFTIVVTFFDALAFGPQPIPVRPFTGRLVRRILGRDAERWG